jgi:hypothetical protein
MCLTACFLFYRAVLFLAMLRDKMFKVDFELQYSQFLH